MLEKWGITALDVKSAFLYGILDEEIYMEQPIDFVSKGNEHKVLRLKRAIYGLKQAARVWWKELDQSLKELGFTRLYADAGIFVAKHSDGTEFLHMGIDKRGGKTYLDQIPYLERILKCFGMTDAKVAITPLPTGYKPESFEGTTTSNLQSQYQSVIGSLLYLMLGTQPDIAFAITQMAKFTVNPSSEHLNKAMYIMCYLVGTHNYALVYDSSSNTGIYAYCDSSYGDDRTELDRKGRSTQGYYFSLASACVK